MSFIVISEGTEGAASVATLGDLPPGVLEGSIRYVQATNTLYFYDGVSWQALSAAAGGLTKIVGGITGDAVTTNFVINHSAGTREFSAYVYTAAAPFEQVIPTIEHTSTTAATIKFGVAPGVGENYIVIIVV